MFSKFEKSKDKILEDWFKSNSVVEFIKNVNKTTALGKIIEDRFFADAWIAIFNKTDDKRWANIYQMFRTLKNNTEKFRTDLEISLKEVMQEYLEGSTEEERKIISSVIFETDIKTLMDDKNIDNIFDIISDDDTLNTLIKNETIRLRNLYKNKSGSRDGTYKTSTEEYSGDMKQIDGLAKHMAIGNWHTPNQQLNANNIYNKFYMTGVKNIDPELELNMADKEIIQSIDKLVSLKSLVLSDRNDRKIIKQYMSHRQNVDAIGRLMHMNKEYIDKARAKLTKNNFDHIAKNNIQAKKTNVKFDLVSEDMIETRSNFGYGMKDLGYYGTISGVRYHKMVGESTEPGYTEGSISISNNTIDGISIKKILSSQYRKNAKLNNEIISTAKLDKSVSNKIDKIILDGGISRSITLSGGQNMIPVHDINGKIVDYVMQIQKQDQIENMDINRQVDSMLSYTFASVAHQQMVTKTNKQVIDTLVKYFDEHKKDDPEGFTKLIAHDPKSGKPRTAANDKWDTIPDYTKDYIYQTTGSQYLMVPNQFLTLMTGYKDVTLGNLNMLNFNMKNNENAREAIMKMGKYVEEIVGYLKRIIVVLGGDVIMGNTLSNFAVAVIHGVPPLEYIKKFKIKYGELAQYEELNRRLSEYRVRSKAGENMDTQIASMKRQLKENAFHDLVVDGQFSPLVEEINVEDQAQGHLAKKISGLVGKDSTGTVKAVTDFLYVNKDNFMYRRALQFTQYGDIVTRQIVKEQMEQEFYEEHGRVQNKKEKQDMLNYLDQLFVNYSYLDNKYMKWFNSSAGMLFTKYLMKQGKAVHSMMEKNPSLFAVVELGQVISGIDIPTPLDTYTNFGVDAMEARMPLSDPLGVGVRIAKPNIFDLFSSS